MGALQIALITLYAFIQPNDTRSFNIGMSIPILAGWFTGLLNGNPEEGLFIGGTLQLMTLGVNTYGGTSVPNTTIGAIVGTALAKDLGQDVALGIAIPVALFMIQLDILARYANIFFIHRADRFVEKREYDKAALQNLLGGIVPGLSRAVPVFIVLVLGNDAIQSVMSWLDANAAWFTKGLSVAGGIIPVVGISILLGYLPTKAKFPFLMLGFLMIAYLGVPLLGVAAFGVVVILLDYFYSSGKWRIGSQTNDAGGDEYED